MSFKDSGLGNQVEVIRDLLDDQMEQITSKIFAFLFEQKIHPQVLLFHFDETGKEQIDLLMDFQENEEIPQCKPDRLAPEIWALLLEKISPSTHSILLARIQALLSMMLANKCRHHLKNNINTALLSYGQSCMMLGSAMANVGVYWHKDSVSSYARKAVAKKLADDPKQKDKALVRECWDAWKNEPDRYKGKAAFARDMRDKFPNLDSQPVIEGWCRTWERES
jgi:hypothetical protein